MFSSFSRRQILSLFGFVGIGTVVAASTPFIGIFFVSKAQAQETEEFVYKGRKYRIVTLLNPESAASINTTVDTSKQLFIGDSQIQITRMENNKYMTPLLFGTYDSPQEVAEILIDSNIKFPSGEVQLDPEVD